jgi:uncharacterized protein YegP (UPF0339 family)
MSMRTARFEVYKAKDGWRWRLKSGNGRIVAQGESHTRKVDAIRAAHTVWLTALRIELFEVEQK